MDALAVAEQDLARIRKHYPAFAALAGRYRDEASFRGRMDSGAAAGVLADFGVRVPPGMQVRFLANTPDTFHFVLPPDPNAAISDESLSNLSAGGKSAGSLATAGTVGTATGTASTVGSASSASSLTIE